MTKSQATSYSLTLREGATPAKGSALTGVAWRGRGDPLDPTFVLRARGRVERVAR